MTKTCTKCGKELPATNEYFGKCARNKSGLRAECKVCQAQQNKGWYSENREKRAEATKKWYAINRDRKIEQEKRWQKANRNRVSENVSKWRKENPEKHLIVVRSYRENNRPLRAIYAQRRIAREKSVDCTLTKEQWHKAVYDFDNSCAYCGERGNLEQDHVAPVSLGGGYTANNIIPACRRCNSSKGNKPLKDWYPLQVFYSVEREAKILKAVGRDGSQQSTGSY